MIMDITNQSLILCTRFFSLVCAVIGLLSMAAIAAPPAGYTLLWSDEFNGTAGTKPSSAKWNYDLGGGGWGHNEWQVYTSDLTHAQIISDTDAEDSKALRIRATKESNGTYLSARLHSRNKMTAKYGYIEARIRMPYGQGIWPAFWMLGTDFPTVGWPASGEIDIMENIGKELSKVYGTLHGTGYSGGNGISGYYTLPNGAQFKDAYHTFAIRWRPDAISWDVDGVVYMTKTVANLPSGTTWLFNKPFFVILNLAVGGNWPGYPDATTVFPQDYRIDYVRAYTYNPPVGQTMTLKSSANNLFVSAGTDGNADLIANRSTAGTSEFFQVIDAGNGSVALKSLANGKYVSAATGTLKANKEAYTDDERFLWVDAGPGKIGLKAVAAGRFVCAENAGASALVANRTVVSGWESFIPAAVGPVDPGAMIDASTCLGLAGGLLTGTEPEHTRLNAEQGGDSGIVVDMADAARFVRRACGLDAFR